LIACFVSFLNLVFVCLSLALPISRGAAERIDPLRQRAAGGELEEELGGGEPYYWLSCDFELYFACFYYFV